MLRTIALLALLISGPAWAQLAEITCNDCRDVYTYPKDFGNYAFNQVLGSQPTVSLAVGGRLIVKNNQNQKAVVDLAYVLSSTGITLDFGIFSLLLPVPAGEVQVLVQDPRGNRTKYFVLTNSPDLKVGADKPPATPPSPTYQPPPELMAALSAEIALIEDILASIEVTGVGILDVQIFANPVFLNLGIISFLLGMLGSM